MKTTHKEKVKLARKLITPQERKWGVALFGSKAWTLRALAISKRIMKKINGNTK